MSGMILEDTGGDILVDGKNHTDRDSMWDIGAKVLGLNDSEAADLFDGWNDRDDVQSVAEEIAERAGERL